MYLLFRVMPKTKITSADRLKNLLSAKFQGNPRAGFFAFNKEYDNEENSSIDFGLTENSIDLSSSSEDLLTPEGMDEINITVNRSKNDKLNPEQGHTSPMINNYVNEKKTKYRKHLKES